MRPLRRADDPCGSDGPGASELDRLRVAAALFWLFVLALVAAVEMGVF